MQRYFGSIPPVFLDGAIYVMMAVCAFWIAFFNEETAKQFIGALALWIIKGSIGTFNAFLLALKMFRSRTFADHQDAKAKETTQTETK